MEVAKRSRGRPKGSKNKTRLLSGATVAQICEYNKHHPTDWLAKVAKGETVGDFIPTADDQFRANVKLHDSIYHNKSLPGGENGGDIDGQYEIVFIEAPGDFQLPGTANAEGITPTVQPEPLQRAGDSSQGWQDSICDQQADT
jgi:hypothetical protein